MDIRKVKKLMEMLEDSSLAEMEIIEGEESIGATSHLMLRILMLQIKYHKM